MSIADTLLALTSYPEPTPSKSIDQAIAVSVALGSRISAVSFELEVQAPGRISFIADALLDIPGMMAAEKQKSSANARALLDIFEQAARQSNIFHERILERCTASQVPDRLVDHARMRDLLIVPVRDGEGIEQWYAESVIFGSGRPTMILPDPTRHQLVPSLQRVAIAWDFGRPAARAVADALPILKQAKVVRAVTVTHEKTIETTRSSAQFAKHMKMHRIDIELDVVDAQSRSIGEVLNIYARSHDVDLLVMGAYGHSRLRDFILGGATKSMLSKPPVPLLLSH